MEATGIAIGLGALVLILFGVLIVLQRKRTYYIPEGFTTEYPDDSSKSTNPITRIIQKVGRLSEFFTNIENWKDAYTTSQMTPAELARMNLHKEKAKEKAGGK
jgi:hypothetical protein